MKVIKDLFVKLADVQEHLQKQLAYLREQTRTCSAEIISVIRETTANPHSTVAGAESKKPTANDPNQAGKTDSHE